MLQELLGRKLGRIEVWFPARIRKPRGPGINLSHAANLPQATLKKVASTKDKPERKQSERFRAIWPDLREMILPRRGMLGFSFVLMAINRLSGLVLPYSTKPLIDKVIGHRQVELLTPLVLAIVGATLVQGVTSFSLTQLLSKTGQRL